MDAVDLQEHASSLFNPDCDLSEVDQLFSQIPLPQGLEDGLLEQPKRTRSVTQPSPPEDARFGPLVTQSQITAVQNSGVPVNTKKNTSWAVNVWTEWADYRRHRCPTECPPHLLTIQACELNDWLCRFVLEVRRKDGKPYPPNTLHQLCCGILCYLREVKPVLDLFKNPEFASFRKTLDAEMKRLKAAPGIQSAPKKAEPILESEEDILWEKGLLGSHSPQSLIDTMVFMAGLYFALRSGEEHRQLRFSSVKLVEKPGSTSYLIYTESTSKNNPGGLKHRKVTTKQVTHHANTEHPDRCFVEMYKQYCLHRPTDVKDDAFYLAPLSSVKGLVWHKKQAIGVHTLVKRLCVKAGISGYKTNHSLRVTTATRLFHSGLDEQLIMERTGHRSSDGVRAYKRSCVEQQAVVSQVLNRENTPRSQQLSTEKTLQSANNQLFSSCNTKSDSQGEQSALTALGTSTDMCLIPPAAFSSTEPKSASQGKENYPPRFSIPAVAFSGCSGITINYNFGK